MSDTIENLKRDIERIRAEGGDACVAVFKEVALLRLLVTLLETELARVRAAPPLYRTEGSR